MPEGKGERENTTVVTTKSGTKVYVVGTYKDKRLRDRVGDRFVNVYNRNFTEREQRQVGNIYYDIYNRDNTAQTTPQPMKNDNRIAQTGTFCGPDARRLNPHRRKMVDTYFAPDVRHDEHTITHEMIHALKFMRGIKGRKHNERKVDFEAVGRLSYHGVRTTNHGYYFSPEGNPFLAKKRGMSLIRKGQIAQQGIFADRLLLTGSMNRSMKGKPIERRVNKMFRKSFFFKRSF